MAVKDHSLDDKIIKAAKDEFLTLGFNKASLHKIAEKAGITTGALYTRYKSKDDLFCSLIKDAFTGIMSEGGHIRDMYYEAHRTKNPEILLEAMKAEQDIYLDMLFSHYDECVLFFCRSGGSSVEKNINAMVEKKSSETVEFFRSLAKKDVDFSGIELILYEQLNYFRLILERGYTKEKAITCMKTVEAFLDAGWKNFFESII